MAKFFDATSKRGDVMADMMGGKYAADGVDLHEGDSFSSFAGDLCRQTY